MAALRAESSRFIDLVASITPEQARLPVAGLDWTVGETAAHVLTVVRRGFADRRRSAVVSETAALNALCLDETPERDPAALAAMLREDVHTALDVVFPKIDDERVFPFHGGVTATITPALHVVLGEFVIHGFDLSRAIGRPWPIAEDVARMVVPGELLGGWVRPDAPVEAYELRFPGADALRFAIAPGSLRVTVRSGDDGAVGGDRVIAMDAAVFVLAFYNRVPTTDPAVTRMQSRFVPS